MFYLYYSIKIKIQNTCCLKAFIGPIQGWLPVGPRRYRLIIECSNWIGLVKGVVCPKTNAWYRGSFNAHKGKVLSIVVENQFKSFRLQQNFEYILVTLHNVPSISYIIIQLKGKSSTTIFLSCHVFHILFNQNENTKHKLPEGVYRPNARLAAHNWMLELDGVCQGIGPSKSYCLVQMGSFKTCKG